MNNILIGIITSDAKNYCWQEFCASVKAFNHPVLFVDNSKGQRNRHFIRKQGFECLYVNPNGRDIRQTMALSHELLRQEAMRRNCDLMHLESDIILKPGDIDALWESNKPVIGYPYFIGFGKDMKLMIQKVEEYTSTNKNVIHPYIDALPSGQIEQVYHCGLGAVLIANWVLEEFKFRWEKNDAELHPDGFFAYDLFQKQIPIFCDTSKVVAHLNRKHWIT